jgi:hypothetical protein
MLFASGSGSMQPVACQSQCCSWLSSGQRTCRSHAAAHAAFRPNCHGTAHASRRASVPGHPSLQTTLSTTVAAEQSPVTGMADDALACVCFTVIIDDIVFPDGRTLMGALGGGGANLHVQHSVLLKAFTSAFNKEQMCAPMLTFHRCPLSGAQSLFGYQLYHKQRTRVGLAAGIGTDFPPACKVCANCAARICSNLSAGQWHGECHGRQTCANVRAGLRRSGLVH